MSGEKVIFASRYGSTAVYAETLSGELGWPAHRAEDVSVDDLCNAPFLVFGSPIYGPSILPAMRDLLRRLYRKGVRVPAAAFVVCGDTLWNARAGEGGKKNLEKLTSLIPVEVTASAVFGGRMRMEELNPEDRERILAFYRRLGKPPEGFDRMDLQAVPSFATAIRQAAGLR